MPIMHAYYCEVEIEEATRSIMENDSIIAESLLLFISTLILRRAGRKIGGISNLRTLLKDH